MKNRFIICLLPFVLLIFQSIAAQNSNGSVRKDKAKIGLLIPDSKSLAAKNGAELAIEEANRNGGYKGEPIELYVKTMDGPWGTGSKAAVSLIFDNSVCALLGSHDGRNAHLAEQVATKSRVLFMSAWSGDPTLAKAFVPWFFSCIPNNLQQADALINDLRSKGKADRITIAADSDYDSNLAADCFLNRCKENNITQVKRISFNSTSARFFQLATDITSSKPGAIILFTKRAAASALYKEIHQKNKELPVYGTVILTDENGITANDLSELNGMIIVSAENRNNAAYKQFVINYKTKFGSAPGSVAAYAYDGMKILIQAIRSSGTERINIQKAISSIKYEGVTGSVSFDRNGNRMGTPGLVDILNGMIVTR